MSGAKLRTTGRSGDRLGQIGTTAMSVGSRDTLVVIGGLRGH
jgi:hypothetical protein